MGKIKKILFIPFLFIGNAFRNVWRGIFSAENQKIIENFFEKVNKFISLMALIFLYTFSFLAGIAYYFSKEGEQDDVLNNLIDGFSKISIYWMLITITCLLSIELLLKSLEIKYSLLKKIDSRNFRFKLSVFLFILLLIIFISAVPF